MVVVIIGIVGAIAIPRMSNSAEYASRNAVIGNRAVLQRALDLYEVEHEGSMIHAGGMDPADMHYRLICKTDHGGTVDDKDGIYGPYIDVIPDNTINGLGSIRKDGADAGANTHGWRYDSNTGQIEPDHLSGTFGYIFATKGKGKGKGKGKAKD